MKRMNSKYAGKCGECGKPFPKGALIDYDRNAPKGLKAFHADCGAIDDVLTRHESERQLSDYGSPDWNDRPIIEIRTASGTFTQRSGGRCEDAPCCGCCTF
jgi:hypothetical protein